MQQVLARGYTTVSLTFVYPPPTGYALEKKVVKSKVGEKVGLPCCHEIPSSESLHSYRVYWQKNTTEVVLAYADGKMISKHEQYVNRTEMDARNLTLWISPVEILDNGSYQCIVHQAGSNRRQNLSCSKKADFSKPNVTADVLADSCESTEMVVRCSSYGGFPKPKLSGALDNESTAWNDSWVSESSLRAYNVTGKLWLNVTKDISFTCSVEYNGFAESTSLLLSSQKDFFFNVVTKKYSEMSLGLMFSSDKGTFKGS
uniref:Ig-like domain-containing protein n=1 Tax=Buteo japonicus TaxID=224669 RepID=A0A8C0AZX6_9AVES